MPTSNKPEIWRTHIPELDQMLGVTRAPWERKYEQLGNSGAKHPVILLRGAPGSGKTTLGLQIAANQLRAQETLETNEKKLVVFLSLETQASMAIDAARERLPRDLSKFLEETDWFLSISRDKLDDGFRKGDWQTVEKGLITFFKKELGERKAMLVFLDSLNLFAEMARNNIAQADQHYDMRAGIYELWRLLRKKTLFPEAAFLSTGEHYASDQAHHHSLMSESFACDIEILLAAEPISGRQLTPDTEASALGYTIERAQVTDQKQMASQFVEMRSFCRVLKSRYTPNQSRRCAYDILPNAGFVFKETFAGDGSVLLYQENERQLQNWDKFLIHDIPHHFPALRHSIFDRPDKQRTFADQRQHLEFPPKIDVQLVCFDSFWPDWYLQLGRRTAINALLHRSLDQAFFPKPEDWHKTKMEAAKRIWSERLCGIDRMYAAALAKMRGNNIDEQVNVKAPDDIHNEFIFGSPLFMVGDITDSFIQKLTQTDAGKRDAVSTYLGSRMNDFAKTCLAAYRDTKECSGRLQDILVENLNRILSENSLYDENRFSQVELRREAKVLQKTNPQGRRLMRLNRWLLEDAFPTELLKRGVWSDANVKIDPTKVCNDNDFEMLWDDLKSGRVSVLRPLPRHKLRLFGERNSDIIAELTKFKIPRNIEVSEKDTPERSEEFYLSVPYNANVSFLVTRENLLAEKRKDLKKLQGREEFCRHFCDICVAVETAAAEQGLATKTFGTACKAEDWKRSAEKSADRLSEEGTLPDTWEEVIALCEMEPKQHMILEAKDLPSFMCFLHELIWGTGHDLVITALYEIEQRQSLKESMFRSLFLLSELIGREIVKINSSVVSVDYARSFPEEEKKLKPRHVEEILPTQKDGPTNRKDWLFARHWHSSLVDLLSAKDPETNKFACHVPDGLLSISPLPFSVGAEKQYKAEKEALKLLDVPTPKAIRWKPGPVSCWGDWHFAVMRGSENDALALEIINNLMSSHKIYERAINGAALPTVDAFYENYGDLPCIQIDGREKIKCNMSYKRIKEEVFSCARTRNRVFDYQHCARDLHSLLAKVNVMAKEAQKNLGRDIEFVLSKIEKHRHESMMIH